MARLSFERGSVYGSQQCYLTVGRLMELLAQLPPEAHLVVNVVPNLTVMRQYASATPEYLGYIDFGAETFVPLEG